jgi:hypothetical protein
MTARYEILQRTFIAPYMLEKGSIIEYKGTPGPHLFPLNAEASDAFERWYEEEHPQLDKDGEPIFFLDENGARTQKMWKPHAAYRRHEYEANPQAEFEFISGPPKAEAPSLEQTIGGIGLKQATLDLRPPPDHVRVAEPEFDLGDDAPVVIAAAPSPKKVDLAKQVKEGASA